MCFLTQRGSGSDSEQRAPGICSTHPSLPLTPQGLDTQTTFCGCVLRSALSLRSGCDPRSPAQPLHPQSSSDGFWAPQRV